MVLVGVDELDDKLICLTEALKHLTNTISLCPTDAELYIVRSAVQTSQRHHNAALIDALKAIQINKENSEGYLR